MRGIGEIRKINENPRSFHGEEHFGGLHREHEAQRHGQTDERPWDGTSSHARVQNADKAAIDALLADLGLIPGQRTLAERTKEQNVRKAMRALDEIFFTALVADLIKSIKPKQPDVQDSIHSAIDAEREPPFFKFWQKLNTELALHGKPEAGYKAAREAFSGGPTPVGALTFIGKEWGGLRAVPAKSQDGRTYHGEFREVTERGTVWRLVSSSCGPICYATPETALNGARAAKSHSENHKS